MWLSPPRYHAAHGEAVTEQGKASNGPPSVLTRRDELGMANWDLAVLVATVFLAVVMPIEAVFKELDAGWLIVASAVVTVLLAADVRRRMRAEPYYINRWFTIDLLAVIPFDLLAEVPGIAESSAAPVIRYLALLRVLRVARIFALQREWRLRTSLNPALLRLAFFAFWIALLAHWIAVGWIAIDGFESGPSDLPPYQSALYWTITTLTTVGYGDITPVGQGQTAYTMVAMAIGAAMYGYIIGNVASLLANVDVLRARHLGRLETINNFMRDRGVPRDLQARVRDYYNYRWESRLGQQSEMLADLPKPLRVDIALHLNRNILRKVPLFETASDEFLRELVLQLEPMVFVPGQALMRRGEPGRELFFINKGNVEVLGPDDNEAIAVLSDGDFVGEMALLDSAPRANTVRAIDYCNVYGLDRAAFAKALQDFPEIAAEVQVVADQRRADSERD